MANRVKTGRLHRRYRGVYGMGHRPLSRAAEWMAAILACGPGSCLACLTAAVHLKLWRRRVTGIDVLVPTRHRGPSGVRVHRCRRLDPRDVTSREGIPVTTVPRTLVDLSDVLTKALDLNKAGSAGTRSELEDRFLLLTSRSGLPEPLVNAQVQDIEVDSHWPHLNLIVEIDGPGHTRPRTKREDQDRDARLRAAGHTVMRVPDHEIDQSSEAVVARLPPTTSAVE